MTARARSGLLTCVAMLAGAGTLAGCGDKKAAGSSGVREAWQAAGLEVTAFATVDGANYAGGKCRAGKVAGLDAVLCDYADDAALSRGVEAGYASLGDETAAVVQHGRSILIIADRARVDPDGQRLNRASNLFRGTE